MNSNTNAKPFVSLGWRGVSGSLSNKDRIKIEREYISGTNENPFSNIQPSSRKNFKYKTQKNSIILTSRFKILFFHFNLCLKVEEFKKY